MLILERPWTRQPPAGIRAAKIPGLRNLWHFVGGNTRCLVTGANWAPPANISAVTWDASFVTIDSLGWATSPATLPLAFHAIAPVSFLIGYAPLSGAATLPWSVMNPIWDGWYGDQATILSTNNTDFSGSVTPTAGPTQDVVDYVAMTMAGANDLRAVNGGGAIALDSACASPTPTSPNSAFYLGGFSTEASLRAKVRVKYVAAFDRAMSDAELRTFTLNPWQLFAPRRIYIPTASAAASTYTMSNATWTNLTATGVTPRVTVTVA